MAIIMRTKMSDILGFTDSTKESFTMDKEKWEALCAKACVIINNETMPDYRKTNNGWETVWRWPSNEEVRKMLGLTTEAEYDGMCIVIDGNARERSKMHFLKF